MNTAQRLAGVTLKPILAALSRQRRPQVDGRIYLRGLRGEVTIRRDQWGIPHLSAGHRHDLIFGQGFVHAQDRLWQMELNRRVATGRLAAVLGPAALNTDRLTRTLGFNRLAVQSLARMRGQVVEDLEAYTAGVNGYLEGRPKLPIEFTLLRYSPERWTVEDSVAFGRLQAWALSHGWAAELSRAQLNETVGAALAAELEPEYPAQHPITLPDSVRFSRLSLDPMTRAAAGPFLGKGSLDGGGRGSNGWVIAPALSASGHALLANDMHLPVTSPALWYFLHLMGEGEAGLRVTGVSQPGIPYVLVGHNAHIAWGATLSFIDVEDLFVERLHPDDPRRYEFRGEWRPAEVVDEYIQVKGQPDHLERVISTHHGPIVSQALAGGGEALAMCSYALRPLDPFDGFARLNEATDWDTFTAAVRLIETPSLNIVYADDKDNIGYYVSGLAPVRGAGKGLVPAPGWSGEYDWVGEAPFEAMPHALNPSEGQIITCNNCIGGDNHEPFLGGTWMNGYRARRLEALIAAERKESGKISAEACRRFQMDVFSLPGLELVERLAGMETTDGDAALSLALLRQWDGWLTADSVGGAVYQVLLVRLAHTILGRHLNEAQRLDYLGVGQHPLLYPVTEYYGHWNVTLMRLLDKPGSGWLPAAEREPVLARCLAETTAELRERLGPDSGQWHWGRLHQVRFVHAMAVQPPLDLVFNQGPYPIGGDTNTVCQTAMAYDRPYENNAFSVSYRQVIELGDLEDGQAMFAPGESGHMGSIHYGDLIKPWLKGETFRMIWSEAAVAAGARHKLTLGPSPG